MAGQPIKLDVLANVRAFQAGTDDVADALEDVSDSLDDMVRDGERGNEKLERSFADLARDARRHGDDAGAGFKKGTKRAFDELPNEARQSGREAAASFSGEATDILDFAQETLANGLGPLGIAGGAILGSLAAVGLQWVQDMEQRGAEIQASAGNMFGELVENGKLALTEAFVQTQLKDLLGGDEAAQIVADVRTESERLGLSEQTLLRARAGDQAALNEVLVAARETHERIVGSINQATEDGQAQLLLEQQKHQETLDAYEDQNSAAQLAVERAGLFAGAVDQGNVKLGESLRIMQDIADRAETLGNDGIVVKVTPDMSALETALGKPRNIIVNATG
jgi:polyhydroxyalkanoate synthesis regulator phasin